jgi:hypothetical protein
MTTSEDGTIKDIVIYSHRQYLILAGISLLMVGLSIYALIYPFEITGQDVMGRFFKSITPGLFYISAPLFSLPFLYTCYRVLKPTPALIINQEGIFDNASIFSAGMIRWEEIKSLFIYNVMDNRLLGIIPVNIETILARQSSVKRFLLRIGNDSSAAPFAIPEALLPMSLEELLANIETYRNNRSQSDAWLLCFSNALDLMKRPNTKRPLWKCPKCGHRFVTANIWHSCGHYRLADHFAGKPLLRKIFDRYVAVARTHGAVTVYAQKTRIVMQGRVRFAGAVVRKDWLDAAMG